MSAADVPRFGVVASPACAAGGEVADCATVPALCVCPDVQCYGVQRLPPWDGTKSAHPD